MRALLLAFLVIFVAKIRGSPTVSHQKRSFSGYKISDDYYEWSGGNVDYDEWYPDQDNLEHPTEDKDDFEDAEEISRLIEALRDANPSTAQSDQATPRLLASGVELTGATSSNPFRTGWTANLREQTLIGQVPKEWLNAFTRTIGWLSLDVLYGGNALKRALQDP